MPLCLQHAQQHSTCDISGQQQQQQLLQLPPEPRPLAGATAASNIETRFMHTTTLKRILSYASSPAVANHRQPCSPHGQKSPDTGYLRFDSFERFAYKLCHCCMVVLTKPWSTQHGKAAPRRDPPGVCLSSKCAACYANSRRIIRNPNRHTLINVSSQTCAADHPAHSVPW